MTSIHPLARGLRARKRAAISPCLLLLAACGGGGDGAVVSSDPGHVTSPTPVAAAPQLGAPPSATTPAPAAPAAPPSASPAPAPAETPPLIAQPGPDPAPAPTAPPVNFADPPAVTTYLFVCRYTNQDQGTVQVAIDASAFPWATVTVQASNQSLQSALKDDGDGSRLRNGEVSTSGDANDGWAQIGTRTTGYPTIYSFGGGKLIGVTLDSATRSLPGSGVQCS